MFCGAASGKSQTAYLYAYGAIGEWLYAVVGGIALVVGRTAGRYFRHILRGGIRQLIRFRWMTAQPSRLVAGELVHYLQGQLEVALRAGLAVQHCH